MLNCDGQESICIEGQIPRNLHSVYTSSFGECVFIQNCFNFIAIGT